MRRCAQVFILRVVVTREQIKGILGGVGRISRSKFNIISTKSKLCYIIKYFIPNIIYKVYTPKYLINSI